MYLLWANGLAHLLLRAPDGEHVNELAPARIEVFESIASQDGSSEPGGERWLRGTTIQGLGDLSKSRFPVSPGDVVHIEVPLCKDNGTECRTLSAGAEVGEAKRGKVTFTVAASASRAVSPPGIAVRIYDFAAEWCPPCQLMAAEVLHDPADLALLAPFELVTVDADSADSWSLKSQYAVGGYPTLVAVDSAGGEVDRFLGYPSESALKVWLGGLASATPIVALRAGPQAGTDGYEAAKTALRFAQLGEMDAAKLWLSVASPDALQTRQARLLVEPTAADVDWLLANAADGNWLYDVVAAFPERFPSIASRVAGIEPGLAASAMVAYADYIEKANAEAATVARSGALSLIFSQMTTDASHNRGLIIDLTDLLTATGNFRRAMMILDEYVRLYPDEFTWDFVAARLYADQEDFANAEKRARIALAKAHGDQRLRTVVRLAGILKEQGRSADAIPVLEAELAAPAPAAEVAVRTHKYRKEAESALAEAKKAATTGTTLPSTRTGP